MPKRSDTELVRRIQRAYPQVYLTCHVRHTSRRHAHGLSARDSSVLAHLDELAPVTAGKLARHLGVGASTVTEAVDRLVDHGLAIRTRHARDRRRVEIRLTPEGVEVMQASSVLDSARVAELVRAIPPARRAAAVRGLEALATAARRLMLAYRRTLDPTRPRRRS